MSRIPGIRRLVRLASGRSTVDADIDDELAFHFERTVEELAARGLSPDAARREAERRFGDVRATRARLREIDGAARRQLLLRERLGALALDVRMAARGLRRSPALALAIVLTLALGLGANATMFGIVDRLLLRPPPHVADPGRAGRIWVRRPIESGMFTGSYLGYAVFADLKANTRAFSHLAAVANTEHTVGAGEGARPMRTSEVTGEFFPMLGARPLFGRFLGPADDVPGAAPAVVIAWETWQRDFGGAASAVGAPLSLDGRPYTVVGVAPRGFAGAELGRVGAWITMSAAGYEQRMDADWRTSYDRTWLNVVGRLAPGASRERAEAELTTAFRASMAGESQPANRRRYFKDAQVLLGDLVEQRGPNGTQEARVALWLAGVAAIVLLVACANVANLLLARAVQREGELAVQLALGAAAGRLARQFLVEGALLAVAGGSAALLIATFGGRTVAPLLLPDVAWDRGPVDGRVLLATLAIVGATTLLVTLSPVLQSRRVAVHDALRAGGRRTTGRLSRLRTTLTVAQAALSVLLLVGAGLFVRSLQRAQGTELGVDAERVLYVTADLRGAGFAPERDRAFWREAHARLAALPGVESASLSVTAPFMSFWAQDLYSQDRDSIPPLTDGPPSLNAATPEFLRTLGIRVLRGRDLDAGDVAGSPPVVLVNETAARHLFGGRDALGRCFRVGADTAPCLEVVGVVADSRNDALSRPPAAQYYIPLAQFQPSRWHYLFVRAAAPDARALVPAIRRTLQSIDAGLPYADVAPMADLVAPQLRPWRLGATLFTAFGALALAVAAVGLYGVLAYDVAQRTRELGVRAALGARRTDVVWLVMRRGMTVAAVGVALGVGASLVAARWIGDLLFEVPARDPLTIGVVAAVLLLVATVASLLPAWRAARVSPQVALRAE